MVVAQGTCPNCGAPIEFAIGASIAKVCEYCRHTVVRSDRGLGEIGKAADLAPTSSLIGIGDEGTLGGRPFRVLGRVQLDYGKGPWDEYYVAFDHGAAWGWLAYAQGRWHTTMLVPGIPVPGYRELAPERDVVLGQAGTLRVAEVRSARVVSAEGELPGPFPAGLTRYYADLHGANSAFGTIDYGDGAQPPEVYLGWIFPEPALSVVQLGPRSPQRVQTTTIRCPNCGGDVPALAGGRSERLGCPYCGAVSDIAARTVVAQQEVARQAPVIPIGSRGTLAGAEHVCIALVRRGSYFDGELYEWEEFLLWSQATGYSWLVKDPETGWSRVEAVNLADLDLREMPEAVRWGDRRFTARNRNEATVTYVLGEVYWKCQVGERTAVADFVDRGDVLSREESPGEVIWSFSRPISWPVIAHAFGLRVDAPGGRVGGTGSARPSRAGGFVALFFIVIVLMVLINLAEEFGGGAVHVPLGGGPFRGGGVYSGGK